MQNRDKKLYKQYIRVWQFHDFFFENGKIRKNPDINQNYVHGAIDENILESGRDAALPAFGHYAITVSQY